MTQPLETPDRLEAPAPAYPPIVRVQIALEARLTACPACQAPLFKIEHKPFVNDEGQGFVVRLRFTCEAGAAVMITPSAMVRAYAIDPCREVMRQAVERIAGEAMIYGKEAERS